MEAEKEEEKIAKKELTPEECQEEIQRIETKLESLEEQKHRYFLGLKKVRPTCQHCNPLKHVLTDLMWRC